MTEKKKRKKKQQSVHGDGVSEASAAETPPAARLETPPPSSLPPQAPQPPQQLPAVPPVAAVMEDGTNGPYRVIMTPHLGRAAVATRLISVGEVAMQDRPFMIFPKIRRDDAVFNDMDRVAEKFKLQAGILYPALYYVKASEEVREKIKKFHIPSFEECGYKKDLYFSAIRELLTIPDFAASGLSDEELVSFLLILRTNVHMLGDGTKASALYDDGSKVAHSCGPNTISLMVGTTLVYRAIRPIKEGEVLSFSYISGFDLWRSTASRRRMLMDQRFFVCVCDRCTGPDYCRMMRCKRCSSSLVIRFDIDGPEQQRLEPAMEEETTTVFPPREESKLTIEQATALEDALKDTVIREEANVPTKPEAYTWVCQNRECKARWRDVDMPLQLELCLEACILRCFFRQNSRVQNVPALAQALHTVCVEKLGEYHWCTALVVYSMMALHHTSLNKNEPTWSTGKDVITWAQHLMNWFEIAMPRSMPHGTIAKFCGESAQVYGVKMLACRWFAIALPLLAVSQTCKSKDVKEMSDYVFEHGTDEEKEAAESALKEPPIVIYKHVVKEVATEVVKLVEKPKVVTKVKYVNK